MTDVLTLPLRTDSDVATLVDDVVGEPIRPQVWVLLLGADDLPLPVLLPIDDLPVVADRREAVRFAAALDGIAEGAGARSVLLAWERPGPEDLTPTEAAWARNLTDAFGSRRIRLRALVLVSDGGQRRLDSGSIAGTAFARPGPAEGPPRLSPRARPRSSGTGPAAAARAGSPRPDR